jgi:hypothetical protein
MMSSSMMFLTALFNSFSLEIDTILSMILAESIDFFTPLFEALALSSLTSASFRLIRCREH